MPRRLTTLTMSLADVLRSRAAFVLPPTQRAYAWSELQVNRLLADAGYKLSASTARAEPPPWLFLGTIYLADLPDGTTAVADGQQRLVTGIMLHAGARDLETDPALKDRHAEVVDAGLDSSGALLPRLRLRDLDAAFFQRWVLDRGAMLRPFNPDDGEGEDVGVAPPLSASQANILDNRSLIIEKLKALPPEERRRFMAGIDAATELIVVTAPTVREALNAYASTQRRGLMQADTDRLKFEIIGDAPRNVRSELANHWDEVESHLGKDGLHDLCGVLLQNRTGGAPPADVVTGMLEAFDLPAQAEPFIMGTLIPSAAAFGHLLTRGEHIVPWLSTGIASRKRARRIKDHVATLMRVSHEEWRGPAIAAMTTLQTDLGRLEEVLAALERLSAVLMIVGVDPHTILKRYTDVTAAILTRDRQAILAATEVDADLKTRARDLLASAKFAEKPRYRAPVLMKLNDLAAGEVSSKPVTEVSCEHVLPQNVTRANTTWREAFRSAKGGAFNGHHYRHRLGNLTILTHIENRTCSDKPYMAKRSILMSSAFALSRELAKDHDVWSPAVIEARTAALVARLVKEWHLAP